MDNNATTTSAANANGIPPIRLILSMVGPLFLLALAYNLKINIAKNIFVGLIRSSLQLLFLGYVLLNILFSLQSFLLILVYFFIMISIAALETISRQQRTYEGHYFDSFRACLFGGGLMGMYGTLVIFHPSPWWLPQVIVPTCGMIIGNSVSGPAMAVERLLSEVTERTHELETRLSFGGTYYESILPIFRIAMQAALLPAFNQLAIMGLVSIPGMMTGQILGGTPPLIAAEYQMAILYLIVTTMAFSSIVAVVLAIRNAVFQLSEHRLTMNKIIKTKKTEIDAQLYNLLKLLVEKVIGGWSPVQDLESSVHNGKIEMSVPSSMSNIDDSDDLELFGLVSFQITINKPFSSQKDTVLQLVEMNVKSGDQNVLFTNDGLNISLYDGEIVTIEGRSGLGKTRLLRAIAGLDAPHQGYCVYRSKYVPHLKSIVDLSQQSQFHVQQPVFWEIPSWRSHIIYVPQAVAALEGMPKEMLVECLEYSSRKSFVPSDWHQRVMKNIDIVILAMEEKFLLPKGIFSEKKWNTLSGGERQRCVIICGLLLALYISRTTFIRQILSSSATLVDEERAGGEGNREDRKGVVLLLDEPCAACDPHTTFAMEEVFQASGLTMLLITHNELQAQRLAHRRIVLS
eukprot:gene2002-2137_t